MSMRPIHNTYTALGGEEISPVLPVTRDCSGYAYSIQFNGTSLSATLQYTRDDVFASTFTSAAAQWTSLGTVTANDAGTVDGPVTAFRLVYQGDENSTITLNIIATP